tara:strand:+ start:1159 stop:1773 length:615 start_codon:yes stop_codon:yes gene_type:complete
MIALFSMGHVMIVRQALVSVTRNTAWDASATSNVSANIPGPYRGALQIQVTNRDGFAFNQGNGGKITQSMLAGSGGFGSQTALQALNNEPLAENPMTARTTYGTYRYDGLNFGPSLMQSTRAAVVLPRQHKRKVYKAGGSNDHVASEWASAPYDPSSTGNGNSLPLNPVYAGYFGDGEGIWLNGARVSGSVQSEHSFFRSRVTK